MPAPLISSPVLIDPIVTKLENLILDGQFAPGTKLRERALAEQLGVSRGPLREAIRTLEGRRLLERTPNAGVQVVGLSLDDLDQILRTREALEGMAARLAAENMTANEINALSQTLISVEQREEASVGSVYSGGPDNDFHRLIAKGSRNVWLSKMLVEDVYSLLRLYRLQAVRYADVSEGASEHKQIIERIHARDGDGAEAAMRVHLRNSRQRTMDLLTTRR